VHLDVVADGPGPVRAHLSGNATFPQLPKILDALEALPRDRPIEVHVTGLHHLDHACRTSLDGWAVRHSEERITLVRPAAGAR
jgi:hypothetical protein